MSEYVTEHFRVSEFACKDGTPYPKEWVEFRLKPLCNQLEIIRSHFGKPIRIKSAYRTVIHNRAVGGAKFSKHLAGIAVDFVVKGVDPRQVAIELEKLIESGKISEGGIGSYSNFTHYDLRKNKARWTGV